MLRTAVTGFKGFFESKGGSRDFSNVMCTWAVAAGREPLLSAASAASSSASPLVS